MSATPAVSAASELPRRSRLPSSEPLRLRLLEVAGIMPVVAFIAWSMSKSWEEAAEAYLPGLLVWIAVIAVVDLIPIHVWGSVEIAISFPVLLAAGMVFPPYLACFLAFVSSLDVREFRREITLLRGLFNRAHIAASVLAASIVFHAMGGDFSRWPAVIGAGFAALVADVVVNGSLVLAGTHLLTGVQLRQVWRKMTGGEAPLNFLACYGAFGLLALLLALAHDSAGAWGLVVFTIPLLLTRQMFVHWNRVTAASRELWAKEQALVSVTQRIADERREERLTMAAGIHDEVLPLLFQVHLMGQVLKQDLTSGKLLSLDEDLPQLLKATDAASEAMRGLIRDLRVSPLGSGGLARTLRLLVNHLAALTSARFVLDLEDVGGSSVTQLLAYQIAREALTNAARHAEANVIRLRLSASEGYMRLLVQDDGRGFDPASVNRNQHFGLQLMRDRAELVEGLILVDSAPGRGTTVVARVLLEPGV